MQRPLLQTSQFWLCVAILCHLFVLLSFSLGWKANVILEPQKRPYLEIPSYVYHEQAPPPIQESAVQQKSVKDKFALQKATLTPTSTPQNRQLTAVASAPKDQPPVHMIGDKKVDNKLMKALGRALSAHLIYPKIAIDFKIKGTALVGMTLHPDGHITDVQLVESSRTEVLDNAAIAAVTGASPISHAGLYLQKPKYIVVGIMFR